MKVRTNGLKRRKEGQNCCRHQKLWDKRQENIER